MCRRQEVVAGAVIVVAEPQARARQLPVLQAREVRVPQAQAPLGQVPQAEPEPVVPHPRAVVRQVALRPALVLRAVKDEAPVADPECSPSPVALRPAARRTTASRVQLA